MSTDKTENNTQGAEVLTVEILESEQLIQNAVASYSAKEATLAKYEQEAKTLKIVGVDDKAGYKAVDTKRKEIKRLRLEVTAEEKALLEKPKKYIEAVRAEAERIVNRLKAAESELDKEQKRVDALIAAAEAEKARKAKELFDKRTAEFFAIGGAFNGAFYHIGRATLTPDNLKTADDATWTGFMATAQAEADRIAEEERIRKEEQEELARLRAQLNQGQTPQATTQAPEPTERVNGTPAPGAVGYVGPKASAPAPHFTAPITHSTNPGAANIAFDIPKAPAPGAPTASGEPPVMKAFGAAGIPQNPNVGHIRHGFKLGWYACVDEVLSIMNDKSLTTRGQVMDKINSLKR